MVISGFADGEEDGEGADGRNQQEGEEEINSAHSHGEGGDDEA